MDNLILIVDELAALHAFLPAIIKFSLIILICLLAYAYSIDFLDSFCCFW